MAQTPEPLAVPLPEHQVMARALGIDLTSIDWTKIAAFLPFIAGLLGSLKPPLA